VKGNLQAADIFVFEGLWHGTDEILGEKDFYVKFTQKFGLLA